ncbi:MAG: class I SAM-dependent methyltransferase [Pseudohongiellaceae bacterium]
MKNYLLLLIASCAMLNAQAQVVDAVSLQATLSDAAGRPDADKALDVNRKPAEVLEFLGIERGMQVVDLIAAAGYYTEVLSHAVGPNGRVYMQNSEAGLSGERGARTAVAIEQRLASNRLRNVEIIMATPDELPLADNSLDAAVIALEFHEFYLSDNPNAARDFLQEMRRVLKPGAVLGIIDHAGHPVFDPGPLHRVEERRVVADAQAAGFFVAASGKMLRNIDDDRSRIVFAEGLRRNTDRFVLRAINR